ncbi:hypothetical protein FACS1894178_7880 [Bacteroidia bacterium]|nr:hypothetical protein FACS1894178_7880 [Bacteroidia bacterium]
MKTLPFITLLALITTQSFAQHSLQSRYNLPRAGDKIVKQQVAYKDPGRAGDNVLWDFSYLEIINDEYVLQYSNSAESDTYPSVHDTAFLTGTEHYTMYYYRISDSVVEIVGYENPVNLAKYTLPLLKDVYPLNYGDSIEREYALEGIYSQKHPFGNIGTVNIKADAYGMLVTPDDDTLFNVLRVKTVQGVGAENFLPNEAVGVLETMRYFARGFRYPVFETLRMYDDSSSIFATAFFFPPPQDEHFETPDTANANLLSVETQCIASLPENPWEGMYYNLSPNPVSDIVRFEIYLPKPVNNLNIQVTKKSGIPVLIQQKGAFSEGLNAIFLNLSHLPFDYYALDFWLDGYLVSGTMVLKL